MSDTKLLRLTPVYTADFYRGVLNQAHALVQDLNEDPKKPLPFFKQLDDAFRAAITKMVPSDAHKHDIPLDRNLIKIVTDTRDRVQRFDQRVLFAFMGATRESMSYPLPADEAPLGSKQKHWHHVYEIHRLVEGERDASELYRAFVPIEFRPPEKSRDVAAFAEECNRASARVRIVVDKLNVILDRISMGVTTPSQPTCSCRPASANAR